jgi:oxygen-dependent protoporphyrinogen oxidase
VTAGGVVPRVAVIGGGIAGLAAAFELATASECDVVVFEAADRVGGRIDDSRFAGVDHLEAGADAFLARVPDAIQLAREVGLADELVSPEPVGAAVWFDGLHPIPEGLLLGLPGRLAPLAATKLLSLRGKARAAIEPFLPRTSIESDSIGELVRARFGDEVHVRLVDSLVGSIYATDTDRFSLREVPQLYDIARNERSLLVGARRRAGAGAATAASASGPSPIFATPRGGLSQLTGATAAAINDAGGEVRTSVSVDALRSVPGTNGWSIDGESFDAVILASPARATSSVIAEAAPDAADLLGRAETADVVMVTLHVPDAQWPERLSGLSGYLVPKPVQRSITAVSFGSQKWAHWRPPAGGQVLRVSVGRDGVTSLDRSDDAIVSEVLDDLRRHVDVAFTPLEIRVSRWPGAFAQYRPHHHRWVTAVESALPDRLFVTGSSYRGIGIPACVRDGRSTARRAASLVGGLQDCGS